MVDSINGVNAPQNVTQNRNRNADRAEQQNEGRRIQDDVQISEEAINLAEAERSAEETRQTLADNQDITLSSDNDETERLAQQ